MIGLRGIFCGTVLRSGRQRPNPPLIVFHFLFLVFSSSSTFCSRAHLLLLLLFLLLSLPRTLITLWRDLAQLAFTLTTACFPLASSLLSFMSKGARCFAARFLKHEHDQSFYRERTTLRYNLLVNCDLRAPITYSCIMIFCVCTRGKL